MNKLLNLKNCYLIFCAAAFFYGCGQDEPQKDYVAKVNNSYLTEAELQASSDPNSVRAEVIKNWIDREVLYQRALKEGIIDREEFIRILQDAKKELAASMMLREIIEKEKIVVEEDETRDFYENNKELFRINEKTFVMNMAGFSTEDNAISFRSKALESGWENALNGAINDKAPKELINQTIIPESEIFPHNVKRIVTQLYPNEISLVIPDERNHFVVAQIINRYESGSIPEFEIINQKVKDILIAKKKKQLLDDFMKLLYQENEIEIKK
ncbi:MAG: peptidyl-prolyl cis-trans isomerase [Ignavibacteriaceae bacterium]|nr:peptidyl-prolyl cis-trans isomerase [Ignavibacteriaceae bacterium]